MFKLFIYDTGDENNKEQAEDRFDENDWIVSLPAANQEELTTGLDRLVQQGWQFDRVLVQTHGGPGAIMFGKDRIGSTYFSAVIPSRHIYKLFPFYTRIYFDGCNVAADEAGTDFIIAVGNGLLQRAGGEVFAWTSPGYAFPSFVLPASAEGHTFHFSGNVKKAYFSAGGRLSNPPDD